MSQESDNLVEFKILQEMGEKSSKTIRSFINASKALESLHSTLLSDYPDLAAAVGLVQSSIRDIEFTYLEASRKDLSAQASRVNMDEAIRAAQAELKNQSS